MQSVSKFQPTGGRNDIRRHILFGSSPHCRSCKKISSYKPLPSVRRRSQSTNKEYNRWPSGITGWHMQYIQHIQYIHYIHHIHYIHYSTLHCIHYIALRYITLYITLHYIHYNTLHLIHYINYTTYITYITIITYATYLTLNYIHSSHIIG